jgi:glycosyltransferase involved in cell wall biosynthesis
LNILIINHHAGSKKRGMVYRSYYIGKELVKLGHNVSIVGSSYSHLRDKINVKDEIESGIRYFWESNISYIGNGIRRAINIFIFSMKIFLKAKKYVEKTSPDLVIASSPNPFIIIGAKRIASLSKAKLFFEVRDLWPLTLIEVGGMSKFHPFVFIMQLIENYAYRCSDKVISVLPKANAYMVKHGMTPDKFVYIPNGINVDEWKKSEKIPFEIERSLHKERKKGNFLIAYTGAHGQANSLGVLISAANFLKDKKVHFFLVGSGPEKINLVKKAKLLNLNNVTFLDKVKKSSIPNLLSYFDALFVGLKKEAIFEYGISPNKIMDYMMAGKPIIQAINAGNDLVKEAKCGYSVEAENYIEISKAILKLMSLDNSERNKLGLNTKKYVVSNHSYDKLANKLLEVYRKLL